MKILKVIFKYLYNMTCVHVQFVAGQMETSNNKISKNVKKTIINSIKYYTCALTLLPTQLN